eukprot:COSAG01_NODE_51511_length_354_cov_0.870588_2_plen_22_part_01
MALRKQEEGERREGEEDTNIND